MGLGYGGAGRRRQVDRLFLTQPAIPPVLLAALAALPFPGNSSRVNGLRSRAQDQAQKSVGMPAGT